MPVFYIIVTFPMQSKRDRILTFIIAVTVLITSITNRAGALRILISYLTIIIFYLVLKMKINKKFISVIVFLALITPFYLLYLGVSGQDVFKMVLGENKEEGYKQENLRSDTRTFLYVDVFRDLQLNRAFVFGKGINAGYASDDFETFNRLAVEVGFLQVLLKSGILGFLLYVLLIVTAIFKAINKSRNLFIKYLGMILSAYVVMLFIENMILYNLLNIIVWLIVGMCHSSELRELSDEEIKELFTGTEPKLAVK
jgi:O-antigen ligase